MQQENLLRFLKLCLKGEGTGGLLAGRPGIGKTNALFKAIAEYGIAKDQYFYATNYCTPRAFFDLLLENNNKIIILDDSELFLGNKIIQNFLRSALWANNSERKIIYYTSKQKSEFVFTGKILMILNYLPKEIETLKDRVPFMEYNLSNPEILSIAEAEILPKEYKGLPFGDRKIVFEYVKSQTTKDKIISFRTYIKAMDAFLFDRKNFKQMIQI